MTDLEKNQAFTETENMDKRLKGNICILGLGGSLAYGTNTPTSDIDVRGVAVRTKEDILLGNDWETITGTETDTVVYSYDKILKLLSECNPNTIEIFGLRDQDYIYMNDIGKELLDNRKIFLSKRCIDTFGGYANAQLYRLRQKSLQALDEREFNTHIAKTINGMTDHLYKGYGISGWTMFVNNENRLCFHIEQQNDVDAEKLSHLLNEINNVIKQYKDPSKRNKKAIEHNKIKKHAMHLLRLYMMGIDLLEKQEIITYRTEEHDLLMAIRNGEYSDENDCMNKEFFDLLNQYELRFNIAKTNTKLPDKPDFEKINQLRMKVNGMICKK